MKNDKVVRLNLFDPGNYKEGGCICLSLTFVLAAICIFVYIINYRMPPVAIICMVSMLSIASLMLFRANIYICNYILLDDEKRIIIENRQFFNKKSVKILGTFNDVRSVTLETIMEYADGYTKFLNFFIVILMKDNSEIKIGDMAVTLFYEDGQSFYFDRDIKKLRDLALELAERFDCKVYYGNRIPMEEQLERER